MKGIFYSTIVVVFITPLILLTLANVSLYQSDIHADTTKIVADRLDSYSESIEDDAGRALSIMAKRSVTFAIIHIENSGQPLNDSGAALKELITNGTINGNGSSSNFTVASWSSILRQKGERFGFETNITVTNITFFSIDSYNVGVTMEVMANVSSPAFSMELNRIYSTTVPISVEGLNDPLYTLNTNGILKRAIKPPNSSVSGPQNFDSAVSNGFYMASPDGAGFLDRLEGRLRNSGKYNTTTAAVGLESVVFVPSLQANGISVHTDKTDVDYLYFDQAFYSGSAVNQSSYAWLRIDSQHAAVYNLTTI